MASRSARRLVEPTRTPRRPATELDPLGGRCPAPFDPTPCLCLYDRGRNLERLLSPPFLQ